MPKKSTRDRLLTYRISIGKPPNPATIAKKPYAASLPTPFAKSHSALAEVPPGNFAKSIFAGRGSSHGGLQTGAFPSLGAKFHYGNSAATNALGNLRSNKVG